MTLHGKLFWNDFDQVSYKYFEKLKADPNLKTWEYQMGLTRTPEEFVWMNCREIGMTLTSGVQTAHFDIHGGYYEDPVIMAGVKRLGEIRRESLQCPDRTSCGNTAVGRRRFTTLPPLSQPRRPSRHTLAESIERTDRRNGDGRSVRCGTAERPGAA